ncbi:MAG: 50S ribosomal protein L32e [Methanocellales archaeon]|nr:50S ribosomal protein L32e [Methanocellales archaeon]MDD3421082.1 50S ribosomal protein L32e [Methanocellales archaeon]MDD4898213.1 50S ribosomal protein L32e [Methanocellales archaeon]MDD5446682.1 50S ribosomal protein L32e [Methanocellales archaeon]
MDEMIEGIPKIKGLGKAKALALYQSGFKSVDDIRRASIDDLTAVKGISPSLAESIQKAVSAKKSFSDEKEHLLKVRKRQKSKKPSFRRHDSHKKKKLDESWRYPIGMHNKLRKRIAAKGAVVQIGYGSPKEVRGLHPSGYEEVLVHRPKDIENINETEQAIRIGGGVGKKKRLDIEEKAEEFGIKVLNPTARE